MGDRHAGYIVTLEHDIREDDAAEIVVALSMTKGVLSVEPVVSDHRVHMAEERVRHELGKRLFAVVYPRKGEADA